MSQVTKQHSNALISVIIPTWRRPEQLGETLQAILACDPAPSEILVQVDASDDVTIDFLDRNYREQVLYEQNATRGGPGGSRNALLRKAKYEIVCSFDDDSYPFDRDYFLRVQQLFNEHPKTAVLSAVIATPNQVTPARGERIVQTQSFGCGASAFRRDAMLQTTGFTTLRHPYGIEEIDIAFQLVDSGWDVVTTDKLRVFHNTTHEHHATKQITAAHIANTALLCFLRFPYRQWPYGCAKIASRVCYSVRRGRVRGVIPGILQIPNLIFKHREQRAPVSSSTVSRMRRRQRLVPIAESRTANQDVSK